MSEVLVPTLGESVVEATVARWLRQAGEHVARDEILVELETDKVTLEVPAPESGILRTLHVKQGETVSVGGVLAEIDTSATKAESSAPASPAPEPHSATQEEEQEQEEEEQSESRADTAKLLSPAVRKLVAENALDPSAIAPTGKDGRLTKADVLEHLEKRPQLPAHDAVSTHPVSDGSSDSAASVSSAPRQERVRMSRLRQRVAERLKAAQNTAAMLTTFNEIDMSAVSEIRTRYKDPFEKKHGVRLGFMGFFVKASIEALRAFPAVNAEIDGQDIVYKNHYDIGVAVSTPQGLVVPVLRDADSRSLAQIESAITDMGARARDGRLTLEDMNGGTFTITNGGVFGSLLSTPILNPPQVGILGMHKIQQRPVVLPDGSLAARPMMYVALTYDHRIIDGREAVSFLMHIKETLEDPRRLLLGL